MGGHDDTLAARAWVSDWLALAAELGWNDSQLQALCIQANLERMAGRMEVARELVARALRLGPVDSPGEMALLRAVAACVEPGAPFEDFEGADPFSAIGSVIQSERAVMEGRFAELLLVWTPAQRHPLGSQEALVGFVPSAAGLVALRRYEEAEPLARRAMEAADHSGSRPAAVAAQAVLAECAVHSGNFALAQTLLGDPGDPPLGGLAGALVRRARAVLGDETALLELRRDAHDLMAPGLLMGLSAE